jgi:hypothetical protein
MTPSEVKADIATRLAGIVPYITVDKVLNHQMGSLPALAIYIPTSSGQSVSEDEPAFVAVMNITIDVIVSQATNYSSDLDNYVEQIKTRLFNDLDFIQQFDEIAGWDVNSDYDNEGETPTATAELTIQVGQLEVYQPV